MVLGLVLRDQEERQLVFDFEALLPDDVDMGDDRDENGKKDFKRGTVVCRHWLRGLCMKGDNCEFLHQYDMSKMPECRWGMECQVPECPFRHVPDEERVECAFYKQGFCSHGPNCRYRHIKLAREECPETADFSLQSKVADEENVKRRKAQPVNEFYKIAICKHWEKMGTCPFGDDCHFAHGEKELRPFPKGERDARHGGPGGPGAPGGGNGMHGGMGASKGPESAAPTGPPPVVLPDEGKFCKYFIVPSFSYHNVAHGVHFNQWSLPRELQQTLKFASETSDDVFLYFTVSSSKHFQGVARLVPGALIQAGSEEGEDLSMSLVPYQSDNKGAWSGAFGIEWLRICECPWERLMEYENQNLAVNECSNGQELEPEVGQAIMRLIFNSPQIQLHYRSVEDEQKLPGGAEELATRRREAAESIFGGPAPKWKVTTPGFVFACNHTNIDEVFGRMLMGLGSEHEAVATKSITPGTPLFLVNMADRHILGVFEAISPAVVNLMPGAFSHGPQQPSPLPVQVRFVVALNAPAINSAEPQIKAIFGDRGIQVGPLALQATQRLADVFSERCAGPMFNQPPPMNMNMGMPPGRGGNGPGPDQAAAASGPPPFRRPSATGSAGSRDPSSSSAFLEKMLVGIEPDNEFGVTRRIIGPGGSHMKRISQEAGGGAKIKVRGRGSGSKESTEDEANEPLMIIVSAENERSFRIACELTGQLLDNIHHDYQVFRQRQQQRGGGDRGDRGDRGGYGGYRG
ncbi:hypothetical protein Poli38472_008387 [Pythium oligandrum]|uniref:Uncharacterized protein n=1 Tax=Pythium oligandrum TaxID=41045 RepID=A0A8K1FJ65_PYTOL|nr:hypothetical protein Poli38472_008387 [Pythium oligandrum]|eukprot:TMW65745.1 hypothetical protein Poli38472_008387 [Pythium oligandrum]